MKLGMMLGMTQEMVPFPRHDGNAIDYLKELSQLGSAPFDAALLLPHTCCDKPLII